MFIKTVTLGLFIALALPFASPAIADDGYNLWLDYAPLDKQEQLINARNISAIRLPNQPSATVLAAAHELQTGLKRLLNKTLSTEPKSYRHNIVLGTPNSLPELTKLNLPMEQLGGEGFLIRQVKLHDNPTTLIAANSDIGLLYGSFELLRQLQTGTTLKAIELMSSPRIKLRVLNHWDNLDRSVERGYAGQSLWDWWRLPDVLDPRYRDYARANASIGINGTVLNNVNANATSLTQPYLHKAAALAQVFRPYGIRVYLTARFSAPMELGGLDTADPLDPNVQTWWQHKINEIYRIIPDFGGFLVKANSEGQPGPQDYQRSHADGANMMAAALAPHDGVVMWRAFVYSEHDVEDRAKQAYSEFKPLDGKFANNVLLQVKNGPIDFQPREPFHPMFGAFPKTPLMMEFQITKEYLGFDTHLAYLGPLYEEVLRANTSNSDKQTVASVVDGSLHGYQHTGIAGVSNIGSDRDWTGSIFNQANWYVFGRLSWNPYLSSDDIARQWIQQTLSRNPEFINEVADIMMRSREAVVNYMTPLGLAHLMGTNHHYGPAPWISDLGRPEWNPVYYHCGNAKGIGFDRTQTGSNALAQYSETIAKTFSDPTKIDERFLLWFHHLPWDFTLKSGDKLWERLVKQYDLGLAQVVDMQNRWTALKGQIDDERFNKTASLLTIQRREAKWWRDASIAYFQQLSGLELPEGVEAPPQSLEYYRSLRFPFAPGN